MSVHLRGTTSAARVGGAFESAPHAGKWPQFVLRFSERKLFLLLVDLLAINGALFAALALRPDFSPTLSALWDHLPWFLLLSGLWLVVGLLLDIYDLARAASAMHSLWAAGGAAFLTGAVYLFVPYLTPALPDRRLEALVFPLLATVGVAAWRIIYASVFVQPAFHQRALVLGAGQSAGTLLRAMTEMGASPSNGASGGNPYRGTGYHLIGLIDDDPGKYGGDVEGVPVIGTRHDLVRLAQEHEPDEIIIAITDTEKMDGELFQAILDCREMGTLITTMAALYERLTGRVPVQHAGHDFNIVLPLSRPAAHRPYLAARRLFDLVVSLLGCAVLLCIAPLIWLANHVTSPGPLFYWQERVGQGGRTFQVVKFRSMVVDAEKETGAVWAQKNDRRITPVGRILRKTRLDELPQVWNILKGEMSLIGPRPERPHFVEQLARKIPFYRVRHSIKPGLTGWAQVKYRYASSVEASLIKLQYDLYYIKHQGPYLDVLILLKTLQVVLGLKGM